MVILPRGSLSASMSRNTTGLLAGREENSLAATTPGVLYLTRYRIRSMAAQLTGSGGPAGHGSWWCLHVTSRGPDKRTRGGETKTATPGGRFRKDEN
ncbi:hypothetical protein EYF80_008890 [Liparis tanakae]|uniref:Uncharacterized protein n=1 Tax=Liparis tanakae TaxID=230148 RepID=A0A4Z2ISK9_9TELE|nr:hypothetical protein EYF80_008890 [Liparis tanakae]